MHLFSPEIGLMGTSGIVGPSILQAAGGGYGFKILKQDRVAVAFFGDGAVNNGAFHEGLNMAAIWNLPVLFVCENNQYATEVPFSYSSGNPSVAGRAANYGILAGAVDGNDVLAIYEVAKKALERARAGTGPTLYRVQDLSHSAPRGGNGRLWLSHAGRSRRMEESLPDRPPRVPPFSRRAKRMLDISKPSMPRWPRHRRGGPLRRFQPWPEPATASRARLRSPPEAGRGTRRPAVRQRD